MGAAQHSPSQTPAIAASEVLARQLVALRHLLLDARAPAGDCKHCRALACRQSAVTADVGLLKCSGVTLRGRSEIEVINSNRRQGGFSARGVELASGWQVGTRQTRRLSESLAGSPDPGWEAKGRVL